MKSRSVQRKIMIMLAVVLSTLSLTTATAFASFMANFSYTATGNSLGNWWDYKLTVSNTSSNPANDLYYFNFGIDQDASFAGYLPNNDWYGPVWDGLTYVNNDNGYPNLSPDLFAPGTGIFPGESLIFKFGLSYLAPEIKFKALVWNSEGGDAFDLPTVGTLSSEQSPVPEPSTLLLVGAGLAGAVIWRRKRPAVQ